MKIEKCFYVYEYWRLDTNTCFYVGKGKGNRCFNLRERSSHFINIVNKVDVAVYIIKDNLSEEEAFFLEKETIEDYVYCEGYDIECISCKNQYKSFGKLVNKTFGGEGSSGMKHTDEAKRKMKENHANFLGGNSKRAKSVYCVTTNEIFESISDGTRMYGVRAGDIVSCCKHRLHHAGRFNNGQKLVWIYYDEWLNMSEEEKEKYQDKTIPYIVCLDNEKAYYTKIEASKELGVTANAIGLNLIGKTKTAGGKVFVYYKDYINNK